MSLPINNHVTINKDSITVDGIPLLIEKDSLIITGYGDPKEVTKIMLTLIPSEITIGQLGDDTAEEDSDAEVCLQHTEDGGFVCMSDHPFGSECAAVTAWMEKLKNMPGHGLR